MDQYTARECLTPQALKEYIDQNKIQSIRIGFTDLLGIQRGKLIPIRNLDMLFGKDKDGLACSSAVMALGYDDEFADVSFLPDKRDDMSIVPDLSTVELLPYAPNTAFVQSDLFYKGQPFLVSPRVFLKAVVDRYHSLGYEPTCVCELEFFAYRTDEHGCRIPYVNVPCNCYTVGRMNDACGLIGKISDSLSAMDYKYLGWNHEFCSGQYEFNWGHSPAITAADRGALFKTLCKDLAFETDTQVTFMASPAGSGGASGCHFHLSLNDLKSGENLCADPAGQDGLSNVTRHLAGGILTHAKAISPFLAPTVNCYKRYQPDSYAPTHVSWGDDNRTAYLRVPRPRGAETRLEVRAASAACNPYLALGALLLAGLDGLQRQLEPSEMTNANIYRDASLRSRLQSLPTRLAEAVTYMRADSWVNASFPSELLELFVAIKEREFLNFDRTVTDWEMDTYFKQM